MPKVKVYVPPPGSQEAQRRGCHCSVIDNNHGLRPPGPNKSWWFAVGCPIHLPSID